MILTSVRSSCALMPTERTGGGENILGSSKRMPSRAERMYLFWCFCLPLRALLAGCITIASKMRVYELSAVLSVYAIYAGTGLLAKFVSSILRHFAKGERSVLRLLVFSNDRGNFGGGVWWQLPRVVHGLLMLCYAGFALADVESAYIFAIADVVLAALFWCVYFCSTVASA